jgi:hypothetical protein
MKSYITNQSVADVYGGKFKSKFTPDSLPVAGLPGNCTLWQVFCGCPVVIITVLRGIKSMDHAGSVVILKALCCLTLYEGPDWQLG